MIFVIAEEMLASKRTRALDVLALFRNSALRGHTVLFSSGDAYDLKPKSIVWERWVSRFGGKVLREVQWIAERVAMISPTATTRNAKMIFVKNHDGPNRPLANGFIELDFLSAVRLSGLPLFILVENALSDSEFIRKTMPPTWRNKIREWEACGVIRFENAGGLGEMKRIVQYCSKPGYANPLGLGSLVWCASHVILSDRDSDANRHPSEAARQLERVCRMAGMEARLHILNRRDQESYLPIEALKFIAKKKGSKGEQEEMLRKLDEHFLDYDARCHVALPKIGDKSWFKNLFIEDDKVPWDDEWFFRDGSQTEMIDLAEKIASFL